MINALGNSLNEATSAKTLPRATMKTFLQVLSPYAPHLAEELWEKLGEKPFACQQPWPAYDQALVADDAIVHASRPPSHLAYGTVPRGAPGERASSSSIAVR